jgi:anti-anti-sigma factor
MAVIDASGRLVLGGDAEALRQAVLGAFEQGYRRIAVNMAPLLHTDSAGIGELVSVGMEIQRRGGLVKLVAPRPKVLNILRLTKIDSLFEICQDEQGALDRFRAASPHGA